MQHINFIKAIKLLTETHSVQIKINQVKPNGQVSKVLESPTIQIVNANGSALTRLKDEGFSLSVVDGLVHVDDFAVSSRPRN